LADRVNITSPVGRIVAGSLYKPNDKNFDGKPLVSQSGQARVNFFFALAIPKGTERHWGETSWGRPILEVGARAFPQAYQRQDFAWKIEDGDSQQLNKRNRRPCDQDGYPGNWIIKFNSGFAVPIYRQDGGDFVQEMTPDFVKPGYFVEVCFNVDSNKQQNNSGVYINPSMVCFRAYGPEIIFGPDVNEAGFGQGQLPAGATLAPPASSIPLPAAPLVTQGLPALPSVAPAPLVTQGFPALPQTPQAAAPLPVVPNPAFLQVPPPNPSLPGAGLPAPGATLPSPPAPVAPSSPQYRMTASAQGASREAWHAAGWSDANLIAAGHMVLA
jgi:hypothetical protein